MPSSQNEFDNVQTPLYRKYGTHNDYELQGGVFALPVACDPADLASGESAVVVVQAFCPYRLRTVSFHATKQGSPPMIPAPQTAGPYTFLDGGIRFVGPRLDSNGRTRTWEVCGLYHFAETVYSTPEDGYTLGSPAPFNSYEQLRLHAQYAGGTQPTGGAVADGGDEVKDGYAEAVAVVDFTSGEGYTYSNPSYFPHQFQHPGMINGSVPLPPVPND